MFKIKSKMKYYYLPVFLMVISFFSNAQIWYVTPAGDGNFDGTSWANAFPGSSLQTTIDAANTGEEVWVAAGTYKPTAGADRTASFNMKNGVTLYGSFTGTETSVSQRVFTNGLTSILSGEIGVPGIGDNCYHVINNFNLDNSAVIDGFIIRDANDDRTATTTDGLGGGIYNNGSNPGNICSPTIRNCVITNNQAVFGAGIFNSGYNGGAANPLILNCIIADNTAITGGGGIDNFGLLNGNASPVITNCVIANNTASQRAGAMYCWGGNNGNASPVILNTIFINNSAIDGGAIVADRLNAVSGSSGSSNPNCKNCIFWENTASGSGPQFFILGGATFTATYSDIDLTGQISPHIISGAATGNIDTDPLLVNIVLGAGPDGNWMTNDDGFRLSGVASPCYNTGDNTGVSATDILGNTRINTGIVDMGAYEFNSGILPVMFISFFARPGHYNEVKLYWKTANEQNNKGFYIQRSKNNINFETIDFVKGAINNSDTGNYFFTDVLPDPGQYFYRLKQVDIDDTYTYSNVVSIKSHVRRVNVYPNPAKEIIHISGLFLSEIQNIEVINSNGIKVKTIKKINNGSINIKELPAGVYTLMINTEKEIIARQIIKK